MRTKSFILTFLMMMFCSIGFGQASYWGVPDTHCESTMTMITQIVVDGTIQGADVEIAAFCGDELRGTVRPDETQMNMVYLVIHGNILTAGDPAEVISFRFYDHSAGRELFYPYPDIVFEDNKKIGDIEFLNTQTGIYAGDNLINFTSIAEVNNVKYGTLQAAVNAAQAGETVTLLQSATGAGVVIDKNITVDFGGKTYTINQAVGSAGTETLGFQILKNKTVTLMNGTLTSTAAVEGSKQIKVLIQNYAHLTLSKMNLDDNTDHILYALSNNSGNVNLVGKTNITTDAVAFDVYDYSSAGYEVPTVNVETEGIIKGEIEVSSTIPTNLNISGGTFTVEIEEAWCADGFIPVKNADNTWTVKEGKYVARNTTTGQGYETLVEAVEAATAGQTVELVADATGAGVVINKDVTIDFGGFTYTVNQAVGSAGTESQGFQLLKNNTVTLKNGNIAIAENTNVKWMFNAYADVKLQDLNVNCTNMKAPAANEANYVLVVNNGGGATPKVNYSGVNVTNFPSTNQIWLDPTTTFKAGAGLENSIKTEAGYVVVYNNGEYTAVPAVAKIGDVYYRTLPLAVEAATAGQTVELIADATGAGVVINKNITVDFGGKTYTINQAVGSTGTESQGFQLLKDNTVILQNGYIAIAEGTNVKWMFNAYADVTLAGLNVNCANMKAPAANEANYVLVVNNGGGATPTVNYSGVNVTNFPSTNQIWLDPTTTFKAGAGLENSIKTEAGYVVVYNNGEYTAVPAVAKIGDVYYRTLPLAVEAATAGQTVELIADATGAGLVINKNITVDFGGKTYTINQAVGSTGTESQGFQLLKNNTVTLKNGNIAIAEGTNVKWMFNAYADVTLENLNVNCANMAAPAENEANYVLVVNNGGSATPTVTYTNVIVTNFPSTATAQIWLDPTTTLKAGVGLENSIETEEGYVVVYNNGEYTAIGAVAKIGEAIYPSVAAAVAAAQAGDVIELLVNVTEDVTVNKSVTIDGANKNYTGNISVSGTSTAITVKNVNFVNGTGYAVTTNRIKSITVENCTVTNYGFGFLYANKSTPTVVVKNVTVDGGNYGFHWVYGTTATLENVTMTNVTYGGLYIQNYAGKTINVKNSTISSIAIWERSGSSGVQTFNFEGANTVGTLSASQYAKYVLAAEGATLTAPEGSTVTTTVEGYKAVYKDGKYCLEELNYVAAIGETKYESLQEAIDAAQGGNVIEVIDDINVGKDDVVILEDANGSDKYNTFFKVEGKAITINLNGYNITGDVLDIEPLGGFGLIAMFSIQGGGNLTLNDNGNTSIVKIDNSTVNNVYSLISCYDESTGSKLTINGGNYTLEKAGDNLVHSAGDDAVIINGGTFTLGNVGEDGPGSNYNPWIFNANGKNQRNVIVNGGTFNFDINHQFWANEVYVPETLALQNNGDGTWTVVESVAYAVEKATSTNASARNVGYATLAEAVNPLGNSVDNTVTVIKAHKITSTAVVERDITIDFGGLEVTCSANPAIRIQGNVNVTVKNGKMNTEGYNFILGASDGSSAGNLTIESGTFHGTTTVASVTKGNLNITGGEFSVEPYQGSYAFLINCIDANYNNGATVSISGGTFHNWNPENNAAEGAGTNFCATGYMAEKIECEHGDCYKVIEGVYVAQVGEVKYKTVAAAVAAATAGGTVTLIANVTEDVTISKSLTIDGANFEYTGNIAVSGTSTAMTVKNVNFIDGTGYAVTTNRIKSITVDNCTVTNYGFGFLYANKSTPTVVVKNVTVDGGNYGFHWVYGTTATLENVTMTNVTYGGLYIQNYAGKTINVKNSTISSIAIWERSGSSGVQTFNFEGANTVGTLSASQYAKYVLAAEGATLTAPEGSTVTTTVDDYKVAYEDGKYCLKPCDYVAAIGDVKYESLQAAIDEAVDDDEIDLIKGIYVTEVNNDNTTEILVSGGVSYRALYTVSGKSVTIDLNDNILYSTAVAADFMYNVFAVANGGHLTIKTDGLNGHGQVRNEAASSVYSLLFCYDGTLTIESGNYYLKNGESGCGMIYSQQDETVTVNGGKFILENVGTLSNGSPWIFNAKGQNTQNIIVNSGTFNDDILHQYYPFEVMAPKEKALQYNEGLWTMVDAVAYVDEQHKSRNYYTNEVGYATLEEAVAARKYNENADHVMTVTLLKEIDLGNTTLLVDSDEDYKNSNINFDFAEKDVEGSLTPAIRIQGGANVTIKNGKMNTTGYNFILGASDGSSAGNLTIESGTYTGTVTVASVTKGLLTIKGGEFKVNESDYGATYMINCIDANYNADPRTANVEIYGGTFYGFNPQDNAAETGGHTNFCADGYGAVETSANVWEVTPAQVITFETKWNWVSHYVEGNTGSDILAQLKNGLGAYGVQIKNQNEFTNYNTEEQSWSGNLRATSVTDMYKVNTSLASGETLPIQLTGAVVDPTHYPIELEVNWNYLGYPLSEPVNVGTVFSGFAKEGDYIKSRDQFAEYKDGRWYGNLRSMNPGEGYMYQRSIAGTFTYSYPSTREAVKANITSENNYWVPASSQYANNMTMVAVLDVKGGDYEVAAFVGGEVRGSARPVYIESLDAYMFFLTIHGDEVEEMTFKVYDLATGEEYDLNNRMNYSNDAVVGSIGNPYVLSRGTTGIGESAMSEVNIYPNPTTTGSEVNLGSVCDTVEVFNALGVKIAEYQNVDAIDALETAGIYVIRITNDGNVQNCRLIVK